METIFFLYGKKTIESVLLIEGNSEFYGDKIGRIIFKEEIHGRQRVFILNIDLVDSDRTFEIGVLTNSGMNIVKISDEEFEYSPQEGDKTTFIFGRLKEKVFNFFHKFFLEIASVTTMPI